MTHQESNRIIADFTDYLGKGKSEKNPYLYAMQHAYDHDGLKYHCDWSWLMAAWEKLVYDHFDKDELIYPEPLATMMDLFGHHAQRADLPGCYDILVKAVQHYTTKQSADEGK